MTPLERADQVEIVFLNAKGVYYVDFPETTKNIARVIEEALEEDRKKSPQQSYAYDSKSKP